ncbi:M14 family zinc carboxypeptidase [Dyadobacter jejuensis]|nr:M14 family zinc carboxypeptidase [Dyadobacter jejuensis]
MYKFSILFLCWLTPLFTSAQGPTPESFLGYPKASRFTYHHRIIAYYQEMARQHPTQMQLVEYGRTPEDRPLVVAILTSEKNFGSLEAIRKNHLSRIGLLPSPSKDPDIPIAWLSYNVHGNEASSANTSMQVLYRLLDPTNADSKRILDQSIVLIDPCSNPDGYARYTNWYNGVHSSPPDLTSFSREHREPWPGGRFNHYLFDLNRDWAWQTQHETKARIALYNRWMPHIHADFHEMGSNRSYYFPPAARPFHEAIRPWQKEFNEWIGTYCRKAFDQQGWSYFTRNEYDLFFPSYGDTWPTFNGAIGLTFEQAGDAKAGLALARPSHRDTLTLADRMEHHLTSSFATLEAMVDGKETLTKSFEEYYRLAAQKPEGLIKTYLIKYTGDKAQQEYVVQLLQRQDIQYGRPKKTQTLKVTNINDHQEATILIDSTDMLVSAYQPKSNLIRVLFESQPALEDSLTYDLTSWGLGYQLGLSLFASQEKIEQQPWPEATPIPLELGRNPYAYLVDWKGLGSVKFLSEALQKGLLIHTTNTALTIEGRDYNEGALIITRNGNPKKNLAETLSAMAVKHGVKLHSTTTGFATKGIDLGHDDILAIKTPKIVVIAGEGISPTSYGEIWHYFETQIQYPLTTVPLSSLEKVPFTEIDVLILPNGDYTQDFSPSTYSKIQDWVIQGGKLIAMESATGIFLNNSELGHTKKEPESVIPPNPLQPYNKKTRTAISQTTPGSFFKVDFDHSHPMAFGWEGPYYALIRQAYQRNFLKDGWNVGYLNEDNYRAGFVGADLAPQLTNTLLYGVKEVGRGSIIFMMDDPLFRGMLYKGQILYGNAVFR